MPAIVALGFETAAPRRGRAEQEPRHRRRDQSARNLRQRLHDARTSRQRTVRRSGRRQGPVGLPVKLLRRLNDSMRTSTSGSGEREQPREGTVDAQNPVPSAVVHEVHERAESVARRRALRKMSSFLRLDVVEPGSRMRLTPLNALSRRCDIERLPGARRMPAKRQFDASARSAPEVNYGVCPGRQRRQVPTVL